MSLDEQLEGQRPAWRVRNDQFKSLLLEETTEAQREYIDNDDGHTPYHFHIDGSKLTFERGWSGFYELDGQTVNIADTIERVKKDIEFVQQRTYK